MGKSVKARTSAKSKNEIIFCITNINVTNNGFTLNIFGGGFYKNLI